MTYRLTRMSRGIPEDLGLLLHGRQNPGQFRLPRLGVTVDRGSGFLFVAGMPPAADGHGFQGGIMATASKYDTLADAILSGVGGESNVKSVTHCATRLRFQLDDRSKANKDAVEATPGVITVVE